MANIIEAVVDTCSNKERLELVNYVSVRALFVSVLSDFDGFCLVGIYQGFIGLICTQVAKSLVEKGIKHFESVTDYIAACEEK